MSRFLIAVVVILGLAGLVWWVYHGQQEHKSELRVKAEREEMQKTRIDEMTQKHGADSNDWIGTLAEKYKWGTGSVYSVDLERHLIRADHRPVLAKVSVSDIAKQDSSYRIVLDTYNCSISQDSGPQILFTVDCDSFTAQRIQDVTPKVHNCLIAVISVLSIRKPLNADYFIAKALLLDYTPA